MPYDDLDTRVDLGRPARRVVSLVPSITETLATDRPDRIVGATDWCTHPSDLEVTRVRGTKNPDLKAIIALEPDLVVANREENRELDVRRLRGAGVPVWVTDIRSVPGALTSLADLYSHGLGWPQPEWIEIARDQWCGAGAVQEISRTVAVAIWRDPWMVVGGDTFADDLLWRLGWENVFGDEGDRYPHVELDDLDHCGADVILLPDEPYFFTPADGPEAFANTPSEFVSGRLLTWYGPSLLEARRLVPW